MQRLKVVVVAGGAICIAGTLLPWPSVGQTHRNGFELASALADLGHQLDLGNVRAIAALWFVLPAACGLALLAVALERRWVYTATAAVALLAGGIALAAIWAARQVGLDGEKLGPIVAAFGATMVAAGCTASVVWTGRLKS